MTSLNTQTQPEDISSPLSQEDFNKKKENFRVEVNNFRSRRLSKIVVLNQWWNISLTVAGITMTLITTVLGVFQSSEAFKDLIKFGIGVSGGIAIAAQSAQSEFRVRRKAGEYRLVEAEAVILEHRVSCIKDETELEKLRNSYYELLKRAAEVEASFDKQN